ncbi:hypothetical protein FB451DRAFT_1207379 [Mycena latifolia]|nr:hypothetical protein FB451DRAFT_1207379 [Mycena latifolia]
MHSHVAVPTRFMLLHDLNEDVLAEILSYSDVYTVVCASRLNKHFRALALGKQLWISLLRQLEFHGLIDLPTGETFERHSTSDLIDEVKCVVSGPKTWAPTWSSPGAPKRRIVVPFQREISSVLRNTIRLLPGGRYFALHDQRSLNLFDVATGRSVWVYTHSAPIRSWSFDMRSGGVELFIAVAGPDLHHTNSVHVLHVDLATGQSQTLATLPLPTRLRYLSSPAILGEFLAISFEMEFQAPGLVLFANWRREEHVLLNIPPRDRMLQILTGPILLPGHLGITYAEVEAPQQQLLLVYSFISFAPFWRSTPGMSFWDRVYPRDLFPVASERLAFAGIPIQHYLSIDLSAHRSPLHRTASEILLHTVDLVPVPPSRSIAASVLAKFGAKPTPPPEVKRGVLFSFSFDTSRVPVLRRLSSVSATIPIRSASVALSRYCIRPKFPVVIDALATRENRDTLERRGGNIISRGILVYQGDRDIHLAPHSSAVVALTSRSVTISYYP